MQVAVAVVGRTGSDLRGAGSQVRKAITSVVLGGELGEHVLVTLDETQIDDAVSPGAPFSLCSFL